MADLALGNAASKELPVEVQRMNAVRSFRFTDRMFQGVTFAAALFVLILLGAIILSLFIGELAETIAGLRSG